MLNLLVDKYLISNYGNQSKNNGEWVKIPYLSSDNNPVIPEAPLDGKQYARQNGEWTVVNIPEVDFTEINKKYLKILLLFLLILRLSKVK